MAIFPTSSSGRTSLARQKSGATPVLFQIAIARLHRGASPSSARSGARVVTRQVSLEAKERSHMRWVLRDLDSELSSPWPRRTLRSPGVCHLLVMAGELCPLATAGERCPLATAGALRSAREQRLSGRARVTVQGSRSNAATWCITLPLVTSLHSDTTSATTVRTWAWPIAFHRWLPSRLHYA